MGKWVKKVKEPKRCSKTIDIVSYAFEVGVNGVCVHFTSSDTFKISKLA